MNPLRMWISLFVFSIGVIGCAGADSDSNAPPPPIEAPNETEEPATLTWETLRSEAYTDMISPEMCDPPFTFSLDRKGAYRAGPCTTGNNDYKIGNIMPEELSRISQLADAVFADAVNSETCRAGSTIAQSKTLMKFSDNSEYQILVNGIEHFCYRSDEVNAQALHNYLLTLSQKYYPIRQVEREAR